jgi:hypothetical protein
LGDSGGKTKFEMVKFFFFKNNKVKKTPRVYAREGLIF